MELAKGQQLQISIRTSKRAKRLHLSCGLRGVEAVVPVDYSPIALSDFIASKRSWLLKSSAYYSKLLERCGVDEADTIYYLGSKFRFNVVKDKRPSTTISDGMKIITFHVVDRRKFGQHRQEWYRQETSRIIATRLPVLAAKLGLKYNKVSIKNQKSRWASCSGKGNLNFNLLLAAAPPAVVDYVILHELSHLVELDHSPRFWELVGNVDPKYREHKEWLSSYEPVIKA